MQICKLFSFVNRQFNATSVVCFVVFDCQDKCDLMEMIWSIVTMEENKAIEKIYYYC